MNYLGNSLPIHDSLPKVRGEAKYVSDLNFDHMLHIALVFSSVPHGIVKSINIEKALAVPGVKAVFHCLNTNSNLYNRYRTIIDQQVYNQEQVFNQHVRFVGDRVGAVVATSAKIADYAASLVEVQYEELPYALDISEALLGEIDNIHTDGAVYPLPEMEIGQPAEGLKDLVKVNTTSRLARINHLAMETHGCIADYKADLQELVIYSPNQSIFSVRTVVGDLLSMPYHKVRVIKTTMGGSFGSKQEWIVEPVAAFIAKEMGCCVKLVLNRQQTIISTVTRSPMLGQVETLFTKDGLLKSLDLDVSVDAGAYVGNSYDYALALGYKLTRTYRCPHIKYNSRTVITNTPVSGAFRGWTSPEATIMLEHNLNVAARALNLDDVDIRLKNAAQANDLDNKINLSLENIQLIQCLEKGRKLFDWDNKKALAKQNQGRYRLGVGVACGGHTNGYYPRKQDFTSASLLVNEDGTVQVNITLHDHGCGTVTAFKMLLADTLGISLDQILIAEGDTAHTPFDMGCFASRTTYVVGKTLVDCGHKLISEILTNAAQIYDYAAQDLTYAKGQIFAGNQLIGDLTSVAKASIIKLQKQLQAHHSHINVTNPGVYGVHFAQVEVDTFTGFVKILDYLAVHDIGRVINREICVAQTQGAVMMGAGAALQEELTLTPQGYPKGSLKDYHALICCDAPNIGVEFVEEGAVNGPFGAKSIGEVSHVPVTAAIVGAVNHALDSELCHLPLTPDKILAFLHREGE